MIYEYKVTTIDVGMISDDFYTSEALDKFGKKGWKLVQLTACSTSKWRAIFVKENNKKTSKRGKKNG